MIHLKLSTVFILIVACYYLDVADADCPEGWFLFGSYCYGFGTTPLTWPEAMAVCKCYGGHLAEPTTSKINSWIRALIIKRKIRKSFWIGGHDIFTKKQWKWTHHPSKIGWNSFAKNQPVNKGDQDCLAMGSHLKYMWNSAPCNNRNYFVCQKK